MKTGKERGGEGREIRDRDAPLLAPTRGVSAASRERDLFTGTIVRDIDRVRRRANWAARVQLRRGVDFVVGTPGRVMDLLNRNGSIFRSATRRFRRSIKCLPLGLEEDVEHLEDVPKNRQTFLFSATMPHWVKKLQQKFLVDQVSIDLVGEDTGKINKDIDLMSCAVAFHRMCCVDGFGYGARKRQQKPSCLRKRSETRTR